MWLEHWCLLSHWRSLGKSHESKMLIESINRFVFDFFSSFQIIISVGNTFMIALLSVLMVHDSWLMTIVLRCGRWMLNKATRDGLPLISSIVYRSQMGEEKYVSECIDCARVSAMRHEFDKKKNSFGQKWMQSVQRMWNCGWECVQYIRSEVVKFWWYSHGMKVICSCIWLSAFAILFYLICCLSYRFDDFGTKCMMNFHCATVWKCHRMCDFPFAIRYSTLHGTITHHIFPPTLISFDVFSHIFYGITDKDNRQLYYKYIHKWIIKRSIK